MLAALAEMEELISVWEIINRKLKIRYIKDKGVDPRPFFIAKKWTKIVKNDGDYLGFSIKYKVDYTIKMASDYYIKQKDKERLYA